jgi:hypothetical protein
MKADNNLVKLGSALGQVTLEEFLNWSYQKQMKNLWPTPVDNRRKATKTIDGKLIVELKKQYGDTAPYHLKKYGHLDNIGKSPGAKKGNTNAKRRIIQGHSVSEWSKKIGVSRRRVVDWYQTHNTMVGCVPGIAGAWNKGIKTKEPK